MHDEVMSTPAVSRRALLKGAGGLSLGALAAGIPGALAARSSVRGFHPITGNEISDLGGPWTLKPLLSAASHGSEVATDWLRMAIKLVRETPGFTPPVGSRALAYMSVALYEAIAPGAPGYRSLAGQLNGLTRPPSVNEAIHHWPLVANSTLASMARLLFPTASEENQAAIDDLEIAFSRAHARGLPRRVVSQSTTRGQAVAAHIFAWSQTDGGHEGYTRSFPQDYAAPAGPGLWIPTTPDNPIPLLPSWGSNRPFTVDSVAEYDPGPPPAFSTEPGSAFYREALEVHDVVEALTAEQLTIATFWGDGARTVGATGHVMMILTQVLESRDISLVSAAEAYAKTSIAVAESLISCWDVKYRYNLIRPVSYIQQHIDAGWGGAERALSVGTPPYPEYTSGHSVQTTAFAQVMHDLFGDMPFTDHTHDDLGLEPRAFSSWSAMAAEAAISRLYAGIHFRSAIERGIEQGQRVGKRVSALGFHSIPPVPVGPGPY